MTMTCPRPDAAVELSLRGLPVQAGSVLVQHYRIDRDHSNAFEAWKRMGSPPRPTADQLAALKRSAQLEAAHVSLLASVPQAGALSLKFTLPRQAVSLVALRW